MATVLLVILDHVSVILHMSYHAPHRLCAVMYANTAALSYWCFTCLDDQIVQYVPLTTAQGLVTHALLALAVIKLEQSLRQ
jgi:hypothetical protein